MTPQIPPYTPELYLPGSRGRYRAYPPTTRAREVPGAGFHVRRLAWADQDLNLDGGRASPYQGAHQGNYDVGPLRGLGDEPLLALQVPADLLAKQIANRSAPSAIAPEQVEEQEDQANQLLNLATEIQDAAASAEAAAAATAALEEPNILLRKVGPVPVWAIGLGGIAVLGGGAYLVFRKRVRPNRRRRR